MPYWDHVRSHRRRGGFFRVSEATCFVNGVILLILHNEIRKQDEDSFKLVDCRTGASLFICLGRLWF